MKVALISHRYYGNKDSTINHTTQMIQKAARDGAQLVVLQELHQGAYFCQDENVDKFDLANDYQKDKIYWANVAKDNKVVLVTSLFEKRSEGLYHNTSVVFDSDGKEAGIYRKMHIPDDPNFYEKFYFTPGDLGFKPIDTSLGRLGVLVCWDQWYPEAARLMALSGAKLLIYPTAIGWFDSDDEETKSAQLEAWVAVQRGHAVANNIPVISVNRVGFESDECGGGIKFWGNSFVFDAQGVELFRSNSTDEIVQIVDIDMQKCEQIRRWWPFLRDRRVESYGDITRRFID
ncbi:MULTISPECIES: carbon-nitrogen hydrolase [Campylobacter]|uniref:N-carbamoylputrescine amidohydrolase n=1 Tax=Campylobacter porcelli TaxID=1660073 RepID=A0A1X9SW62_9BACT|nr:MULTISPECIES: carbon-nitrogen hydrolase [unclassified Campylobacter]ARR00485.1 N-carbamoylputrescine amidohydrolase [Campylobacter sp. RM6137]MCR8679395.1 carbon-nitrogen hydrolase [Campylobacter sp. RM19072]MCR8696440.1 carbon-nitrogen hydrolase [Campylobacter sp. RM19073]MEE3704025.1 carbon-nitrogen hydrolase [Campylobacter sp. CX2-8023-23]